MDHLFSPWRFRYIQHPTPEGVCVLCAKLAETNDEENLVVYRGRHNAVMLNLYPYTVGHMMILPYRHVATLGECGPEARVEIIELAARAEAALTEEYRPSGINMGMNLGEAAGAGIAGHIHWHALPRWRGDANFVSVIGETRILPEELAVTWQRLRPRFQS